MSSASPPLIPKFSSLAPDYDVVLSDIWGVIHNGMAAHPHACDALMRMRARRGVVILVTNAPRPSDVVARQLERLHVPRETYDAIVSSGDVTRSVIEERRGQTLYHLGPGRDRSIFSGLNVQFAPPETADYVVCSGLEDDEVETPDDYRVRLESMLARRLFMVCGNPDVVVERGSTLVYCAGAIADLYANMGGEVLYAGKPYRPIYDMALAKAELAAGRKIALSRVLAVGDSVRTDLKGARTAGVDFLFVTSGIHAEELGSRELPDSAALSATFTAAGGMPKAVMRELKW
ncbi:MAG TPA: TIGR01459 family HAD-type hydrolase [Pseudolabrys sp.]|jgi:HAD superfamily hydrolase (TIGR01459 family)|nr:TIGR01459 family HAD-type hydrolase [Pseudolabrys sp.]